MITGGDCWKMYNDIGRFKTETGVEKSLDRAVQVIIIANSCSFFAKTKQQQKKQIIN